MTYMDVGYPEITRQGGGNVGGFLMLLAEPTIREWAWSSSKDRNRTADAAKAPKPRHFSMNPTPTRSDLKPSKFTVTH
jgi:hypothetical protein